MSTCAGAGRWSRRGGLRSRSRYRSRCRDTDRRDRAVHESSCSGSGLRATGQRLHLRAQRPTLSGECTRRRRLWRWRHLLADRLADAGAGRARPLLESVLVRTEQRAELLLTFVRCLRTHEQHAGIHAQILLFIYSVFYWAQINKC